MNRYQIKTDDIAWRVVDGEAVIVHALTSGYFGLNSTGTAIWEALATGPLSAEDIAEGLVSEAEVSSDQVRPAVDAFLTELVGAGLVEEKSTGEDGADAANQTPRLIPIDGYQAPELAPFGELEQLILSGE